MSSELNKLRAKIDRIDRSIIGALAKRKAVERAIGVYKRTHGMKLLDNARRTTVLKTRVAQGKVRGLKPELVSKLFSLIHRYSLSTQKSKKV